MHVCGSWSSACVKGEVAVFVLSTAFLMCVPFGLRARVLCDLMASTRTAKI